MTKGHLLKLSILFVSILALVFPVGVQASAPESDLQQAITTPEVFVLNSTPETVELIFRFPTNPIFPANESGMVFDETLYSHPAEVGMPDLPLLQQAVEVPTGDSFVVEILDSKSSVSPLGENGLPSEIPNRAPEVEKCAPGEICNIVQPDLIHQITGAFPASVAQISNNYILRGHQIVQLQLSPVQYDPIQQTFEVFEEMHLRIMVGGISLERAAVRAAVPSSPAFEQLIASEVLNADVQIASESTRSKSSEGYVIIAPDAFLGTLSNLVSLKQSQGFSVTLAGLSSIGATPDAIKAYLQYTYDTWSTPPTYALLVGDVDNGANTMPAYTGYSSQTVTDLHYGTVDGADWIPDIFIGRLPARNTSQLTTMINNLIAYNNLTGTEGWVKKAAFLASNDSNYWSVAEATQNYVIQNHTQPLGYTGTFPNNPTAGGDKLYATSYGAGNAQVMSAINNNRALITYTGHGSRISWGTPSLNQSNIRSISNSGVFSVVTSFACITGDFQTSESFGETWVLQPNKGAIAFIGSSSSSFWGPDDTLEKAMMDSLYSGADTANIVGAFRYAGLMAIDRTRPGTGTAQSRYYWESYNLLGDPSLEILIGPKSSDFELSVESETLAVCQGGDTSTTVGVTPMNGFSNPVTLSMAGLPSGVSASLSANPVTPPNISQLNLHSDAAVPVGSYQTQLYGDSGSLHHELTVGLQVFDHTPSGVSLGMPINGAVGIPITSIFTWQPSQTDQSYEIQVARDPNFTQIAFSEIGLTDPSYTPPSPLSSNATYYWRVKASNPCGSSSFSAPSQFQTLSAPGSCPTGTAPTEIYHTNFDSAAGWNHYGTNDSWARTTARPHSPQYSFFSVDKNVTSLQHLTSPSISIPDTYGQPVTLKFWQWFNIESNATGCFDGAILEISNNSGQSWMQIPESSLLTNPYVGTISPSYGNPLAGQPGWCGSRDWSETLVDLTRYGGQDVILRFTQGSDASVGWEGWHIDDFSVAACEEKPDYRPYIRNNNVSVGQAPGQEVTIRLQLINAGLNPDTYSIVLSNNLWGASIRTKNEVELLPNGTYTLEIVVNIPQDATFGQIQEFLLTVTSQNKPDAKSEATVEIMAAIMSYIPVVSKR